MIQLNRGISPAQVPTPRARLQTKSSDSSFSQQLNRTGLRGQAPPEIRAATRQNFPARQDFVGTSLWGPFSRPDRAPRIDTVAISSGALAPTEPESTKPQNETDAYWALQPKEVQALKNLQGLEQRAAKAKELMQQGYAVDHEIMVLGYDPYMTMKTRQELGYTWVPAMGQANIPLGPGLSYPGLPSYDPRNPPPGSIPVSISFAKGLEHTTPTANVTVVLAK